MPTSTRNSPPAALPVSRRTSLRVAVASSGLGHVHRGVEAWAADLAPALRRAGTAADLFQNAGEACEPWQIVLNGPRRTAPSLRQKVERLRKLGGWRYGFGNPYQAEQTGFALRLWPRVRHDYDILHVQDPWLALILHRLHRAGLSRPRVLLAHGTEEPPSELCKLNYLQHLAPCYLKDWEAYQPGRQQAFAVPNFVDVERFRPGAKKEARAAWKLPPDAFIVLCVAAIKRHHKRVDYLIEEFARFRETPKGANALLVVAGGREDETDAVVAEGRERLGASVLFLEGVGRYQIPELYRAADVFALASLHEMMPVAVLEALASGLPVACSATPTLRWMIGEAGRTADLRAPGALAAALSELADPACRTWLSLLARSRAEESFSEAAVIPQMLSMYATVTAKGVRT